MGGKHKQAQRTKNNARPSSSCRSAELLGASIPQFVGFSALKENSVMSGLSITTDDIETSMDSNFQLVLKKMSKKDSTTKLKALQEFTELIKTADIEAVKAVLPFWARLYCVLATDADHKVREATHLAHHQVVLKSKRNLAPFLKQFAGPWFTSQYDTHAPAASAATKSFQDAFPKNKTQEAIIYCQDEILTYIWENLTVHTAQTLSNPKTTSVEDAEAKHQRVLISSLHGYALYLQQLSTEQIEKQLDLNLKIISDSKFWKLVKHKVLSIRSAWFCAITSICQKSPNFLENEAGRIVGAVFSHLDETEPTVVQTVWEALLSVLSSITEWWQYVNIDKLVFPKLWKLLKEGGNGNAGVIYPNLLPLISHLPPTSDNSSTFCLFFENMFKGMKHQTSTPSRYESVAISTAYVECLRYIIMKNQSDVSFCEKLIRIHLFPILEWNLTDPQTSYKGFFNQVAKVIQYWSKNSTNTNSPNYLKYLEYFWCNLDSLFQGLLLNLEMTYDKNLLSQFSERQIELLLSLKHIVPNKQLKVSFNIEKVAESVNTSSESIGLVVDKSYTESLNDVVYKTCVSYVKFVNEKHSKELIGALVSLIQDFDSESFFYRLNIEFNKDNANLIDIYRKLLNKWLRDQSTNSKSVIDLVFLLFKYLNDAEKREILNSFIALKNDECFGWCVSQVLSHPHNDDTVIHEWLYNEEVNKFLIAIVEKELTDTSTPELNLILKKAFMEKPNGDLYLSTAAVTNIIQTLNKSLLHPNTYYVAFDTCASFAAYISSIVYTANYKLKYGDELLLAMFGLSCSSNIDSEIISKDTLWEVSTAWQDAVSLFAQELNWIEFEKLAIKCSDMVTSSLLNDLDGNNLNHINELIVNFLKCMEGNPLRMCDVLNLFLNCDLIPLWKEKITNVCIGAEYMMGHLCSPLEPLEFKETDYTDSSFIKYLIWMDLLGHVLTTPMETVEGQEEDDESTYDEIQTVAKAVAIDDIEDLIVHLLDSVTIANLFIGNYPCTQHGESILFRLNSIKAKLQVLFQSLDVESTKKIECKLKENLFANGWLSIKTFHMFCSEIVKIDLRNEYTSALSKCERLENLKLVSLHLTQIFAGSVKYEQVCNRPIDVENIIVLRALIRSDELDVPIAEAFSKICNIQDNISQFLYERNIASSVKWNQAELVIECMRLFSVILKHKSHCISAKQWDTILILLVTWSTNIARLKDKFHNLQIKSLINALTELFASVSEYIKTSDNQSVVNEWKDIFAEGIHKDFVEMWLCICGYYQDKSSEIPLVDLLFLREFGKVLAHLDYTYLFKNKHSSLVKWSKLLQQSCSLLTHPANILQLWGYHMLRALLPGLVEVDSAAVTTNTPHAKGLIFEQFNDTLCHIQDIVESILIDFKLGEDSCRMKPYTDSYAYTSGYLLLWDILLTLCENSSTELRYQYADWLRNGNFLNNLLDNIYKLMPVEILHHTEGKTKHFTELFSTKFCVSLTDSYSSEYIERMVCWCYTSALSQLPALVRQWWSQKEPRISQIVEKVTASFVSSQLCNRELLDITQNETKFKNMVVKVHPTVREVVAVYTVDEAQMELVITLGNNYPLTSPDVQCNRQIGGTSHRQWLMQLKLCVLHQNGRIWDGLLLWNHNLDKKFDGVEECYICFAVLHQGTYQLPKLSCHTCKKKFHSACLYKWFSTSNKSTCPICRNLF